MKDNKKDSIKNPVCYFDYKDTKTLSKYINPHAKILSNRRTQLPGKHQRALALAVKHARFMGLLPYIAQ